MQLQNFNPTTEAPYYYACHFPILHDKLLSKGSLSVLSLIANDQLYSLPSLCVDSEKSLSSVAWYVPLLNHKENIFSFINRPYTHFEEGLEDIKECIKRGEFFIASGTTYYLPYSKDYKNPKYIRSHTNNKHDKYVTDHYLAIYGMTQDEILIHDPVPHKFMGPIAINEFEEFWRGNKSIPEFSSVKGIEKLNNYGTLDVTFKEIITQKNIKDCFITILKSVSKEFMKGTIVSKTKKTYYFGVAASEILKENINQTGFESSNSLQMYSKCLFDMRWSKYFLHDLIKDMSDIVGPSFTSFLNESEEIIKMWENVSKFCQVNLGKSGVNEEDIQFVNQSLTNIIEKEQEFHEKILTTFESPVYY